jgi:hypothetical protein
METPSSSKTLVSILCYLEHGSSRIYQNTGNHLPDYTVSYPRRLQTGIIIFLSLRFFSKIIYLEIFYSQEFWTPTTLTLFFLLSKGNVSFLWAVFYCEPVFKDGHANLKIGRPKLVLWTQEIFH